MKWTNATVFIKVESPSPHMDPRPLSVVWILVSVGLTRKRTSMSPLVLKDNQTPPHQTGQAPRASHVPPVSWQKDGLVDGKTEQQRLM